MTRPVQTPDNIRHDTLQELNPEVDTSEQEPSHESRGQPDVSKHGDLHESISMMTSTMEKLVNRVSQLENNTNQQGTLIPQLVTTPLYPYFHADLASSKYTLEMAMNQCQTTLHPVLKLGIQIPLRTPSGKP